MNTSLLSQKAAWICRVAWFVFAGLGSSLGQNTVLPDLEMVEEREDHISARWSSPLLNDTIPCRVYLPATGEGPFPVVVYLGGLSIPRIGEVDDETLIQQFTAQGLMVIRTNYQDDPRATAPDLLPELDDWYGYLAETVAWPVDPSWIYMLPAGYTMDRNVWICDLGDRAVNMDVFYPSGSSASVPLMLQITSIKDDGFWINQRAYYIYGLLTRGYAGAVMEHNGGTQASPKGVIFPEKRAARLFRANADHWNLSGMLGVTGHSKGSGRAAKSAFINDGVREGDPGPYADESDRFQAVLLSAGQHAIEFLIEDGYLDGVSPEKAEALLRDLESMTPEEIALISTINYVSPDDPPVFMMVGELDKAFRVNQMVRLAAKVAEIGLDHEFVIQPNMPHQYVDDPVVIGRLFDFLDRYLKPAMAVSEAAFSHEGGFAVGCHGLNPTKTYVLKRSTNLADGFTEIVAGPFSPSTSAYSAVDPAPPSGGAFYRIEEVP